MRRWRMMAWFVGLAGVLLILGSSQNTAQAATQKAPVSVRACTDAAYDLIGLVNGVRTGAGLPPFEINGTLMAVAQAHSEYQARIGQGTHTGPDGSRPYDRVKAAGYGGGRHIYVSENIAWGYHLTPQGAVNMWIPSPPHYRTMTGAHYHDVGAGCAQQGDRVYFTLVAAGIAGQAPAPTRPPTNPPPPSPPPPTPTLPYEPVLPATPRPDGAVIHTVRRGQTLMMIAGSYRVPLEDILRYNNLTEDSLLHIGQEIIIVPPRATPTSTATQRPTATATAQEDKTPLAATPRREASAPHNTPTPHTATPGASSAEPPSSSRSRPLDFALAAGFTLALGGYFLSRRIQHPSP